MHLPAAFALSLLLVAPACAQSWQYEGGGTPIAWLDAETAQFQFACRGEQLTMAFWVREPDATVAGASSISVSIEPDAAADSASLGANASYAQDMPLVHLDGASVVVRGPVARQWASIARNARETMRVAFVKAGQGLQSFDDTVFSAKGSSAAIGKVLDQCR